MLDRALEVATQAVKEAGAIVRGYYKDAYTVREKGEDNPLTDADLASDALLKARLLGAFPDTGWLSEETVDDGSRLEHSHVWIVDPLDGTKEFTKGIDEFVVSVALVVHGDAKLGVLYNPIREQLFTGLVGAGCWFNGAPARVTDRRSLQGARVVCSRTEMGKGWFEEYKDLLVPEPVGSVAYKFGLVAAGRADVTFTPRPRHEWDIAGGVALVLAAGGQATDRHGQPFCFNLPKPLVDGVAATNGHIHADILSLMNR